MFSVGFKAITKTDSIGATTSNAIMTALIDQKSKILRNINLFFFISFSIKMSLLEPILHQKTISDCL
tara:strand:- start:643 stop:843 length:201 start_codon:yes stop_codon:yes gene_type:complete